MQDSIEAKQTPQSPKSFLRQWGALIGFGVMVIALILGYSAWTEYQANQPIVEEYDAYLRFLAERSPKARDYRARYQKRYARETVVSGDFPRVCAQMTHLAEDEGVDVAGFRGPMAFNCRRFRAY